MNSSDTTGMAVEVRPAQPISRLAAPSSASTKDSALSRASSETATTSSLGGELSAAMLPPEFPMSQLCRPRLANRGAFSPVWGTVARAYRQRRTPFCWPMGRVDPGTPSVHFPGKFQGENIVYDIQVDCRRHHSGGGCVGARGPCPAIHQRP